jgi:hypothetical protein
VSRRREAIRRNDGKEESEARVAAEEKHHSAANSIRVAVVGDQGEAAPRATIYHGLDKSRQQIIRLLAGRGIREHVESYGSAG